MTATMRRPAPRPIRQVQSSLRTGTNMIPRLALRRLCEAGVPEERVRVTVHPGFGAGVAAALLDLASHRRAAMLVIASHARHGIDRLLHGSVETNVIARATMPVLVARAHR